MAPRLRRIFLNSLVVMVALLAFSGAQHVAAAPAQQQLLPAGPAPEVPSPTDPPVLLAAGDIALCNVDQDSLTAYLLDANPGIVLGIGDNDQKGGSLQEFTDCYGPTWGRHLDRIYPVPGNHEYATGGASGYFTYFGDRATPLEPGCRKDCGGYYSFNYGGWHIVALNSEIPSDPGTLQELWLRADLEANPSVCTLAFWHRPRYSSGSTLGGGSQGLWNALYEYGADIVLSGHDHAYERFAPQDGSAQLDNARGIRQFVVGTGGNGLRDFRYIQPNSEARNSETWGVIKFTLRPDSYDWEFLPIPGKSWTDSGSAACVTAPGVPTQRTTIPVVNATGATTTTPLTPGVGAKYTIVAGDTISLIALRYGLDWRALAAANGLTEESIIEIGQVITLAGVDDATAATPATTAATTAATGAPATPALAAATPPASGAKYTIVAGDTLSLIGLRYGIDWRELATANGLTEDSIIEVGQVITLIGVDAATVGTATATSATAAAATPAAAASTPATYTVQAGETLLGIAVRFNISRRALAATNGLAASAEPRVGQVLTIPAPTTAATVATATQAVAATGVTTTTTAVTATGGSRTHTVASGDTVMGIAAQYGLDWQELLRINGLQPDSIILIGQVLRLE